MDNRSAMRVAVKGQMSGKMLLVESLEILDISMTGIRFRCLRRVNMNSLQRIKIKRNDVSVTLRGTVVRAALKGLQQVQDESLPVYEVGMHFENMSDSEKKGLEQLISILYHG